MGSYKVTLFLNTDFKDDDVPDSPALLARAAAKTIQLAKPLEILQDNFLSYITIDGSDISDTDLDGIDYVQVGSCYYQLDHYEKQSTKAVRLFLEQEYLLTGGGIANLEIISGAISRWNPDSDDIEKNGVFEDPYMVPGMNPSVYVQGQGYGYGKEGQDPTYLATQIDLGAQAYISGILVGDTSTADDKTATAEAETTTDNGLSKAATMTYQTFAIQPDMKTSIRTADGTVLKQQEPYVLYQGIGQEFIIQGVNNLRALGAEDSIVACYSIPEQWIKSVTTQAYEVGSTGGGMYYGGIAGAAGGGTEVIRAVTVQNAIGDDATTHNYNIVTILETNNYNAGLSNAFSRGFELPEDEGSTSNPYKPPENEEIINLSSYTKFGIIGDTGDRIEYEPNRIYDGTTGTVISLIGMADGRPDGHPYYAFARIDGQALRPGDAKFWVNNISGRQWKNVPLSWTAVSGGRISQNEYNMSRAQEDLAYSQETRGGLNKLIMRIGDFLGGTSSGQENDVGSILGGISNWANAAGSVAGAGLAAANATQFAAAGTALTSIGAAGAAGGGALAVGAAALPIIAVGAGVGAAGASRYRQLAHTRETYNLQKTQDLAQYMTGVGVSIPKVGFSYSPDAFSECTGHDCLVYRYQYKADDMRRIDRILTAFGYKTCIMASGDAAKYMDTHVTFNYIEGNLTVKGKTKALPKWLAEGIQAELSGGVRIWHAKPQVITADCNPLK